jgi:hypothetical protein
MALDAQDRLVGVMGLDNADGQIQASTPSPNPTRCVTSTGSATSMPFCAPAADPATAEPTVTLAP